MNMRFASLLCVQIGLAFFLITFLTEEPTYKFTAGFEQDGDCFSECFF
jgi:hypothetical protein